MHRFHDSRFHNVRLVCRLRRGSALASSAPPTPTTAVASTGTLSSQPEPDEATETSSEQGDDGDDEGQEDNPEAPRSEKKEAFSLGIGPGRMIEPGVDRYFIVKSLTLQDLESSAKTGIWATQAHNEETFNKAFEVSLDRSSPSHKLHEFDQPPRHSIARLAGRWG